jgi:hypothetical protein
VLAGKCFVTERADHDQAHLHGLLKSLRLADTLQAAPRLLGTLTRLPRQADRSQEVEQLGQLCMYRAVAGACCTATPHNPMHGKQTMRWPTLLLSIQLMDVRSGTTTMHWTAAQCLTSCCSSWAQTRGHGAASIFQLQDAERGGGDRPTALL